MKYSLLANCIYCRGLYHETVTELHENIAYNMKRRRELLGLSQFQLAERADISAGYIGDLESRRKFPSPEVMLRLAAALEVRPFVLLMSRIDSSDEAGTQAIYDETDRVRTEIDRELGELMERINPGRLGNRKPYDR